MSEAKFNQDELVPPSFLTEAYILDVLRKVEEDPELHVINYEIVPGSSVGDHYASVMFKIIVSYGSKGMIVSDRRFILKTIPETEGQKKEMLEKWPAFRNETGMYTKTLRAMEEILEKHGEKGWWPKMVYANEKPTVIIFDDLTVDKWQVVYDPLDYDQHSMVVDKIAKYHALSMVLKEKDPEKLDGYKMEFNDDMKAMFIPMVRLLMQLADVVKTWPGFEKLGTKLENFGNDMTGIMFQSMMRDNSQDFCVLNHGDFHLRNLMFKKTPTGELSEVLFLDFQLPHQNPPAFDLIGLLTTMANNEVRVREDEVIKAYHGKLVSYMKLYGFEGKVPSLIDIHIGLLRLSEYHAFYSIVLAPLFTLKGVELGDFFSENPGQEFKDAIKKSFSEPNFVKDIQRSLLKFDMRGVFP